MTTFIMKGKYSAESVKQISKGRTVKAVEIIKKSKGKLVAAYAMMGETDLLFITEFPGVAEAIKASINLNKKLGISFATLPALRVEEFDKLASSK
ncbi:MAG: GYD domain-containing protein [Deltaproteobacteria bacterium]|nr:GYD domain-containing protein [Deltaproteobacteria bacterium]